MDESSPEQTTQGRIRVMIVDDHEKVRSGLATVLLAFEDMVLVGEAENGLEAIVACERIQPDVILMDLKMPRMDGVAATRTIHERWPNIQVIALTTLGESELVRGALDAGAAEYLIKNISADQMADMIRKAHAKRQAPPAAASNSPLPA